MLEIVVKDKATKKIIAKEAEKLVWEISFG